MKVLPISSNQYQKQQNFKGYVNGNYYKDEIIEKAKEALDNPLWKEKYLRTKASISERVSSWHEEFDEFGGKKGRILLGVLTLGISEVLMNTGIAAGTAMSNSAVDKTVNEIEKCMKDLKK